MLYPFGLGAMAVNLFFAALIGSWLGLPVLTPVQSVLGGALLGVPASWLFASYIMRLMAKDDHQD
ncbi:NnrT protein [Cypionkella sp. TWP1-2-1b2]|uniref:NnrT protein n=1 Tax=Cypionkella sp. TWP1-2-1b2 TaxID=2804675 RepID=UPI003CEA3D6A